MSPLRQKMSDAMIHRGFAARTQESYIEAMVRMGKYCGQRLDTCTAEEVRAYLLHMVKERHLSYSTMNQAACAVASGPGWCWDWCFGSRASVVEVFVFGWWDVVELAV